MALYFAFGHSVLLDNPRIERFRLLEWLQPRDVRELLCYGPRLRLDYRYRKLVKALHDRYGLRVTILPQAGRRPRPGDQAILVWIESPSRPFLVDPWRYTDEEIAGTEFLFTLEEALG